jgi:DNA polymerase-3 subunit gamma/tau
MIEYFGGVIRIFLFGDNMSLSLYRKYRPKKFAELINQDHIKKTLMHAISSGRVSHAYLFTGPKGTGKTTVARILAKAVNCEKPNHGEPCNVCRTCRDFLSGGTVDLIEIDGASNRGIEEVKGLIEKIRFAPTKSKYKVYVIDEVHMLTKEAFNALLKTLEEPPAHAIFILATTEAYKLPQTIISRCQRFDFHRIKISDLVERLKVIASYEKITIDDESLAAIAENAEGSFRDAEAMLDQILSFSGRRIRLSQVEATLGISDRRSMTKLIDLIIGKDAKGAIELINRILDSGFDLAQFNKRLIEYLRYVLIYKYGQELPEALEEEREKIIEHSQKISDRKLLGLMKEFIDSGRAIKSAILPQIPLEMAIISLIGDECQPSVASSLNPEKVKVLKIDSKIPSKALKIKSAGYAAHSKSNSNINFDQFMDAWPKILRKAKKKNQSLLLLLRTSLPVEIENDKIILVSPYKMYRDQIKQVKRQLAIREIIDEVLGCDLTIDCIDPKDASPEKVNLAEARLKKLEQKMEDDLVRNVEEIFNKEI